MEQAEYMEHQGRGLVPCTARRQHTGVKQPHPKPNPKSIGPYSSKMKCPSSTGVMRIKPIEMEAGLALLQVFTIHHSPRYPPFSTGIQPHNSEASEIPATLTNFIAPSVYTFPSPSVFTLSFHLSNPISYHLPTPNQTH